MTAESEVLARYRQTLNAWAAAHIPPGARVVDVDVTYDDGWDPTLSDRPESLAVRIDYDMATGPAATRSDDTRGAVEVLASMGQLLTALFAIEGDA